jgi:predicted TIM-barrel fold metal-dependent hydrolase
MQYAGDRTIIDADSHVIELDDFVVKFANPSERHLIPPMEAQKELPVSAEGLARGRELLERRQSDPELMAKFEASLLDNKKSGWNRIGAFDPTERSRALDLFGFKLQLVLPTFAYHQIGHEKKPDVLIAGARALNRAMGAFCANDERLRAIGYLPLSLGPEIASELMDEGFRDGCYSFMVDTNEPNPKARSFTHPDFDPIWARFGDRSAPFVVHVAVTGDYEPIPRSFFNNGHKSVKLGGDAPSGALGMVAIANTAQLFLSAMIFDDVFIRHPKLKGIAMEFGSVWLPSWLRSMDVGHDVFKIFQPNLRERDIPPSEYAKRHLKFSPFAGEPLGWITEQVGSDLLVFGSDYPHPEGTSDPIGKFEATMQDCGPETMDKFYFRNMQDVMGIELANV